MEASAGLIVLIDRLKSLDLPTGLYVVDAEYRILYASQVLRDLLYRASGPERKRIIDYYEDSVLGTPVDSLPGELLTTVPDQGTFFRPLRLRGSDIFVQDRSRPVRDPATGTVIGHVGSVVDVTSEESYRRNLPVGAYRVNANGILEDANEPLLTMLRYDRAADLLGKPVIELYADEEVGKESEAILEKVGRFIHRKIELLTREGKRVFVSASSYRLMSATGQHVGREGVLIDIDREERARRIVEYVPVATYEVAIVDGRHIIRACNQKFEEMFEFSADNRAVGKEARELFAGEEDYREFLDTIRRNDHNGMPTLKYFLQMVTQRGRTLTIEVNTQPIHDSTGAISGRAGVLLDVTREEQLRRQVEEFTHDFGQVLHSYSTTLWRVKLSIDSVYTALDPDPFPVGEALAHVVAAREMSEPARAFSDFLRRALSAREPTGFRYTLSRDQISQLQEQLRVWDDLENRVPDLAHRPAVVRDLAARVMFILTAVEEPRHLIRELTRNARELRRICSLISLHRSSDAIVEMGQQVRALREYVTAGTRASQQWEEQTINDLVRQAVTELDEFATSRGVSIRERLPGPAVRVRVNARDVVRAIGNLLHNAIKYSWSRKQGEPPWVEIRARADGRRVLVELENFGVPIPREEITNEVIFRLGHRGRLSTDRGRFGTGIGLPDARRVCRAHRGDVIVESRPASATQEPEDYSSPFLTTATLILPLISPEGIQQ